MTAYDPLRLPDGGRSIACELCEAPVLLALDNPRRVCAACGTVNLPTPEAPAPRLIGGPAAGNPFREFPTLEERSTVSRQPPGLVYGWCSFGLLVLPVVFGAAALGNELAGRGHRGGGTVLGAVLATLFFALPGLLVAAVSRPPAGVSRLWRFLWIFTGMVLSSPLAAYLAVFALIHNWRS